MEGTPYVSIYKGEARVISPKPFPMFSGCNEVDRVQQTALDLFGQFGLCTPTVHLLLTEHPRGGYAAREFKDLDDGNRRLTMNYWAARSSFCLSNVVVSPKVVVEYDPQRRLIHHSSISQDVFFYFSDGNDDKSLEKQHIQSGAINRIFGIRKGARVNPGVKFWDRHYAFYVRSREPFPDFIDQTIKSIDDLKDFVTDLEMERYVALMKNFSGSERNSTGQSLNQLIGEVKRTYNEKGHPSPLTSAEIIDRLIRGTHESWLRLDPKYVEMKRKIKQVKKEFGEERAVMKKEIDDLLLSLAQKIPSSFIDSIVF